MNNDNRIHIIGAGGHSKVVISTLIAAGRAVAGIYDDDTTKIGQKILGIPVCGEIRELERHAGCLAVIAIGDNASRSKIAGKIKFVDWQSTIHPAAYVHPSAKIGRGTVVFAGAVIQPDVVIGEHCIINTGAVIDHDCVIGDYSHIAPGSRLAGGVCVGKGSFLGIGCAAIPNVRIGDWAIVGAGSVVLDDVKEGDKVGGVPASTLRR